MAQPLFDYNKALERLGGDGEFLNELLTDLVIQIDENIENLRQAIKNKNYKDLKTLSHSLKGASANLNVSRMATHFLQLEDLGAGNNTEGAIDLLDQVTEDRNELEQFLNNSNITL